MPCSPNPNSRPACHLLDSSCNRPRTRLR
jgi:hypothetical protein